jgi:8-oxo-dGTP diphosphatase
VELTTEVRAAGGVVVRDGSVLLVHRPKYDDWTLPKGKCNDGEDDESCALREVEEETGLRCRLLRQLPATRYVDSRGRPKRVRWWEMEPLEGAFAPSSEVDDVQWVPLDHAGDALSYERDAELLESVRA